MSECLSAQNELRQVVRFVKAQYHRIFVKVATMSRNYIRQRLGVQREQDRSQNGTLEYSVHKGAWSRHNAINNNRLTTITEVRCKQLNHITYYIPKG